MIYLLCMYDTITISKTEYETMKRQLRELDVLKAERKMNRKAKVEEQIRQGKGKAKDMLHLVGIIPKGSGLPTDLAQNHDRYLWED